MFAFILAFVFSQETTNADKAYKLMIQASATLNKNDQYYNNPQKILNLRSTASEMAKKFCYQSIEIDKLSKSEIVTHRVAAAYAINIGTISTIDENLFKLLLDDNNVVSIAARESFVDIVNRKFKNFVVDQGPSPFANKSQKYEASVLWRIYLFNFNLTHDNYSVEELKALDDLLDQLKKEWANNIHRESNKSQLEPAPELKQESNDPTPSDLLDPSAYTVQVIPRKKELIFKKR